MLLDTFRINAILVNIGSNAIPAGIWNAVEIRLWRCSKLNYDVDPTYSDRRDSIDVDADIGEAGLYVTTMMIVRGFYCCDITT